MWDYQGRSPTTAATPPPPHTYSACSTCQCNFFTEYGSTSVYFRQCDWLFRLFRLTYFSYFRYFSRYSRVIWKCVEISKRIYKNKKSQWSTDRHKLMSRTPCIAVADHQGAADPRLKT